LLFGYFDENFQRFGQLLGNQNCLLQHSGHRQGGRCFCRDCFSSFNGQFRLHQSLIKIHVFRSLLERKMKQPIFSLAYTTVREQMMPSVIEQWRNTATGKYPIEVVISVDGNREDCVKAARQIPDAKVVIQPDEPFNSTRGWNAAAAQTTGKVIICVADDFKPCPGWDEKMFTLKPGWIDEDWVVHTSDGYVENLCVLSILTRIRYDRFGYVFYPEYPSLFSDTEFTEVAYREGRVIQAKHIFMEHLHPDCEKTRPGLLRQSTRQPNALEHG
jgi:hypothetical protein